MVLPTARFSVEHSSLSSPGLTSLARLNNSVTVVEHDVTQVDTATLDRSENSFVALDRSENTFSVFLDMLDEAVPDEVGASVVNNDDGRAECLVCHRWFRITDAGFLRTHGPQDSRCPGSQQPIVTHAHRTTAPNSCNPAEKANIFNLQNIPIIKRIPRASRHHATLKFVSLLKDVVKSNSHDSWSRLLSFAPTHLYAPTRGGKRRSLATTINKQLDNDDGPPESLIYSQESSQIMVLRSSQIMVLRSLHGSQISGTQGPWCLPA